MARSVRTRSLAALHAGKRALGWDVEAYKAFLRDMTGKESSADLDDHEIGRVIDAMRLRGYERKAGAAAPTTSSTDHPAQPQLAKIADLWKELQAIPGALNDPSLAALRSFGTRVTGVHAPEFMTVTQRIQVIEGLKGWIRREKIRVEKAARSGLE